MPVSRFTAVAIPALALAVGLLIVPQSANAAEGEERYEGDRYIKVVFDRDVAGGDYTARWEARCPVSHPYLDESTGTPGMSVGKGIGVTRNSVWTNAIETWREQWPEGTITAIGGYVRNFGAVSEGVKIEMFCTRNFNDAWWGD